MKSTIAVLSDFISGSLYLVYLKFVCLLKYP